MVVDAIDAGVLVADCCSQEYDLTSATEAELLNITMPLDFTVRAYPPTLWDVHSGTRDSLLVCSDTCAHSRELTL